MDSAADFSQFDGQLKSSLLQVTRTINQLSAGDLTFHRSANRELDESFNEESGRLISLTSSLLKAATTGTDLRPPKLRNNEESLEDNWNGVVDVIDALLERADACLDEFTGVIKKLSPSQEDQSAKAAATRKPTNKFPTVYDYGPSRIPKPQLSFVRKMDATDESPFRPLLKTKPHAIVPLEESMKSDESGGYRSPYETEIRAAKYPSSTYDVSPPIDYLPFNSTKATFVDTIEGVMEMLSELKAANEIAIDLEHHDVHAYHGLVSLMQISTREKDWVVDTLKPWREELQVLNEVFADPNILKVLHGSSMDMIWLQRDLGLYIVGLFDTFHAASALGYPKRSLKYLLQKVVNFEADKRYQMADWRIRPLPEGMFDYARSDTHYLLHIFDHLRNELVQQSTPDNNLIDYVLEQSKNEALQRYERPVYDAATGQGAGGWYDYLCRNPAALSKEQFSVFRAVHQWRDAVARAEDEGVQCVFPKHILFKVAHTMPLEMGTLLKVLSPVTPITKNRSYELLEVIKQAKIDGANGPEWRDFIKPAKAAAGAQIAAESDLLEIDNPIAERYEVSQFWGNVLAAQPQESFTPPEYSAMASAEALRLSLPLPPMPKTVAEVTTAKPPSPKPVAPTPEPTTEEEQEDPNKPFTVKEKGGPRKRKAERTPGTDATDPSDEPDIFSLDVTDETTKPKLSKSEKRRERKKNKAPKLDQDQSEEAPFDYEAAASVLHAQPAQHEKLTRRTKKKPFNPQSKLLETPAGARKYQRDVPGKQATYR